MIPYDPKDAEMIWPEGEYSAVVQSVTEKRSKAGNDMYEVAFTCYAGEREMRVTDYIVMPDFVWKLKRLARAFGLEDQFKAGAFDPSDMIGRNLVVALYVKKQDGFEDRNTVTAYKPKTNGGMTGQSASFTAAVESANPAAKPTAKPADDDNDLPF